MSIRPNQGFSLLRSVVTKLFWLGVLQQCIGDRKKEQKSSIVFLFPSHLGS